MAFEEYHDMYLDCQQNMGKYFMICFDLIDSQNYCGLTLKDYQAKYQDYLNAFNADPHHYMSLGDAISFIYEGDFPNYSSLDTLAAIKAVGLPYHVAFGWCDTLDWTAGNELYYGGYLFQELMTKHKKEEGK